VASNLKYQSSYHATRRLLLHPRQIGPTDTSGVVWAAIIGLALLTLFLGLETQRIAYLDGYRPDLGRPIVGHLYQPYGALQWMSAVDERFDLQRVIHGGPYFARAANEKPWARAAFAAFRTRFMFEGLAAFVVFLVCTALWAKRKRTSGLYGSQHWATSADLRRSPLTRAALGIVLGQEPKSGRLFIHDGQETVLGVGSPGVGKTDGIAVPTLNATWPGSAIVFDPSGDLVTRTIAQRRQYGSVYVFDPRDPHTAALNPLDGVAADATDRILKILASAMLEKDLSEMEPASQFFLSSALELGSAVVGRSIELGNASLTGAANLYYSLPWANDGEFCQSLMASTIQHVAETGSKFERMDHELRSSIIGTLTRFLSLFRSDDVARATERTTFSLNALRAKPSTLYLVVREGDQASLNPLLRLVLTRLLDDATDRIPEPDEQTILAMIDEFPLLKAPAIKSKLATLRKFRVRPVLLAQSATQIKEHYGTFESITGICDVRVIFPSFDELTQELATQSCGEETVWKLHDHAGRDQRSTFEEVGRPLLPSETLGSPAFRNHVLIAKKGEFPILATPVRAHADPRFNRIREQARQPEAPAPSRSGFDQAVTLNPSP
jgi:type IV secretion system protein VirD4